ncbi:MAG TPA: alpha/beta fold hydrolase [Microbacterium sp.]|nr:alpha/beta fold hydrolase [Microbacterium sp.]
MTDPMRLNVVESGSGDRTVLLLHGMTGSAESWWRVAEELAARGRRVLAIDLPGHGLSPRDPTSTVASAADAVVDTLVALAPGRRLIAMGHSYGGTVLAAAATRLLIDSAVYVDTACAFAGGADRDELIAQYASDRRSRRDASWLRETRPFYSEKDAVVEARAADRFDPVTAASISSGADVEHIPAPGSILVRADPSRFVTDEDAHRLAARGVEVRTIPGAAHTVWFSHFDEFVTALPEVFGADPPVGA